MSDICWLQLLDYEYFLVFVVFFDSKLNIFGFWTVGQTNVKRSTWARGNLGAFFTIFWHFTNKTIEKIIDRIIKIIVSCLNSSTQGESMKACTHYNMHAAQAHIKLHLLQFAQSETFKLSCKNIVLELSALSKSWG